MREALDPRLKDLLSQPADPNARAIEETPLADLRRQFEEEIRSVDKPGPDMRTVREETVEVGGAAIPLRWYAPSTLAKAEGNGVLIYFHGGGWIQGSIETHDSICRMLAHHGRCLVASAGYRLSPESKFPVPLEDCYGVTRWVHEHAAAFGGDPERLAVGGDSAGGNLAAAVTLRARDEALPLRFQLLLYPVTDLASETESKRKYSKGFWLDTLPFLIRSYIARTEDELDPLASPLRAEDLSGLPRAYIVTAGFDPLRDEGELYAERLREAGVATEYRCYESMIHGFVSLRGLLDAGDAALVECGQRLRVV